MREHTVWNSLHAGDILPPEPPPPADYPVSLLTKRTLGTNAGGILADRQHAPQAVCLRTAVHRKRNN